VTLALCLAVILLAALLAPAASPGPVDLRPLEVDLRARLVGAAVERTSEER